MPKLFAQRIILRFYKFNDGTDDKQFVTKTTTGSRMSALLSRPLSNKRNQHALIRQRRKNSCLHWASPGPGRTEVHYLISFTLMARVILLRLSIT
jgi:hypothetical protein